MERATKPAQKPHLPTSKKPSRTPRTKAISLVLLFLLSFTFMISLATTTLKSKLLKPPPPHARTKPTSFLLNNTCTKTLYPLLCFSTLSPLLSKATTTQLHLAEASINRTLRSTESAFKKIKRLSSSSGHRIIRRQKAALDDCVDMLDQTLDELRQAVGELRATSGPANRPFGDLRTLLSAAMTNQNSCLEGFSDDGDGGGGKKQRRLKNYVKNRLTPISRMVSNSLAIVKDMEGGMVNAQRSRRSGITRVPSWTTESDAMKLMGVRPDATVARNGSGDYRTIGEAVRAAPANRRDRFVILIRAGVYEEKVEIPMEKTNLVFVGDGRDRTVISWRDNAADGSTTFKSATLGVAGDGFMARDLTVINTSGPSKRQAVALRVNANRAAFYRCKISSYQDSLYAHSLRQFYRDCSIHGTVDFIFGNAAVVLQNCLIVALLPGPTQKNMLTAQGRNDPNQNTGISLQNCTVIASPELDRVRRQTGVPTYLGRPWRKYSRTMVMRSYLGGLIHPDGWHVWNESVRVDKVEYVEYMNRGPGSDTSGRVWWARHRKNVSELVAGEFGVEELIQGRDWLGSTGVPFHDFMY